MTALPCCAERISLWAANATPDNGRDGDGDRVVGRNGVADATAPVIIPKSFAMAPPTRTRLARSDRRPTGYAALDLVPATSCDDFFPPPSALHREPKKPPPAAFHFVPALRVRVDRLRSHDRHRVAMGAALKQGNETMANIGTFTSNGTGFTGTIRTLALNVKARFVRIENPSDKGPHFRILAPGNVELGAAWQKRSEQTDRDYLSVKLDDPSFPSAIYASLVEVEGEEGLQLIWSRPNRD